MKRNLVLGIGNPLMGDDGVGIRVIECLKEGEIGSEIMDGGTSGLSLLEVLGKYEKVVVVDAVEMGKPPGSVVKYTSEELLNWPGTRKFSLHEFGLQEVLAIGRGLGEDFSRMVVIGVQPKDFETADILSTEVESRIPEVIELIKKEVI